MFVRKPYWSWLQKNQFDFEDDRLPSVAQSGYFRFNFELFKGV